MSKKNRLFPAKVRKMHPNSLKNLEATKWVKGQSGNEKGRDPLPLSLTQAHRNGLTEIVPFRIMEMLGNNIWGTGKAPKEWYDRKVTWMEAVTLRNMFRMVAPQGDQIIKTVWEMLEGRAVMKIAGAEGGPIKIEEVTELDKLSLDELKELRRLIEKARGK